MNGNPFARVRVSARQTTSILTWSGVLVAFVIITLQLLHLLKPVDDDFQHPLPETLHGNDPNANANKLHSIFNKEKEKKASNADLFLTLNEPFARRSVRLKSPIKGAKAETDEPPSPSQKNSRRFSHMRCLGDEKSVDARRERICVFENVCYAVKEQEWRYFVRPDTERKPILFDSVLGERFDFWEKDAAIFNGVPYDLGFIALGAFTQGKTDFGFKVHQSLSPATTSPSTTVTLSNLHALFLLAVHDDNLGHVLWEEIGALWYSMIRLNAYSTELVAMSYPEPLPTRPLSKKFRDAFFPAITSHTPVSFFEYISTLGEIGKTQHICFDQLLAGGNMLRFFQSHAWHNQGHEPLFYALRNRILRAHSIDWRETPKRHQIVFTNKTETIKSSAVTKKGNHGISNLAEVVEFTRALYPSVLVRVVEWHKMPIREQLELMQQTTVLVTPSGGVSTLLPFLPEGAHAIILDYFEREGDVYYGTEKNTSVSMEAPLWNHFPHVRKLYYQVWENAAKNGDLVSDAEGKSVEEADWRYEVSTKIDFGRLERLLEAAFEDMEP